MRRLSWLLGALGALLVVSWLVVRFVGGAQEPGWQALGVAGAVLLLAFVALDREGLGGAASSRAARQISAAGVITLLALAVTVAVNVVAERYDKRVDATGRGVHTLAPQSVDVAGRLDRDVSVVGFFESDHVDGVRFRDLLEAYQEHSERLQVQVVDPVRERWLAERYEVDAFNTVVLEAGEDQQRIEGVIDEERVTNALLKLQTRARRVICFTSGHGERDTEGVDGPGWSGARTRLEGQNHEVRVVELLRTGQVPTDCNVLVLADPQVDFLPHERETLAAWVVGGGSLLAMLDPLHAPELAADLRRYGVAVGNDLVLEDNPNFQLLGADASYLVFSGESFDHHPVTTPLTGFVLFRVVRSVDVVEGVAPGLRVQPLALTTQFAWGETDLTSGANPAPDGPDRVGRLPVMVAGEVADPSVIPVGRRSLAEAEEAAVERRAGARFVVVGDSDFASNDLLLQGQNHDLLLNVVSWLLADEQGITLRANEAGASTLSVTALQGVLVWLVCLLLAPSLAFMGAVSTWLRRRRL